MKFTANRFILLLSALILAGGIATLGGAFLATGSKQGAGALGGPFSLVNQNGEKVDQRLFTGKPTLLFFGYTHCPDICPTKLFEVAQLMQKLGKDADRLNIVFTSIDPERDSPELLKDYLGSFDPRFVGLTGSPEAIASFAKSWRAYYRKAEPSENGYSMDHTAALYLLDKSGQFSTLIDLERAPDRAEAMVKAALQS